MAFPVLPVKEMERFAQELFDRPEQARKAAGILKGSLEAQSPRLSDIARAIPGKPGANYKAIQRFLQPTELQDVLLRLFDAGAPFVLGDPTEIPRQQAKKTAYVGRLSDGKTLGFWLLVLARPSHGRALPFAFITSSEGTLAQEGPPAIWSISGPFGRSRSCWARSPGCWTGNSATRGCSRPRRRRGSSTWCA